MPARAYDPFSTLASGTFLLAALLMLSLGGPLHAAAVRSGLQPAFAVQPPVSMLLLAAVMTASAVVLSVRRKVRPPRLVQVAAAGSIPAVGVLLYGPLLAAI